jgi:hypothetical protein
VLLSPRDKEPCVQFYRCLLSWPADDQEKVARFVRELEHGARTMISPMRNGRLLKRAPPAAIWRPTKRSNRCSALSTMHEASIRAQRARRSR